MESAFTQEWRIVTHFDRDQKCQLENWDLEFGSNTTEFFLFFFSEFSHFLVVFESQIPNHTSPQRDVCC